MARSSAPAVFLMPAWTRRRAEPGRGVTPPSTGGDVRRVQRRAGGRSRVHLGADGRRARRRGSRSPIDAPRPRSLSGGSIRTTFSSVRLTSSPLARARSMTGAASMRSSTPRISPAPRTSTMIGCCERQRPQAPFEVRANGLHVLEQALVHQAARGRTPRRAWRAGCRRRCCRDRRPRSLRDALGQRAPRRPARRSRAPCRRR